MLIRLSLYAPDVFKDSSTSPVFQWGSYTHANIGGVTPGRFCVGCSSYVQHLGKVTIPVSKFKQTLAETLRADVGGKKCEDPSMDKFSLQEYGVKRVYMRLPIELSYLLNTMLVRSVFSRDSVWSMRRFSPQEIGS